MMESLKYSLFFCSVDDFMEHLYPPVDKENLATHVSGNYVLDIDFVNLDPECQKSQTNMTECCS